MNEQVESMRNQLTGLLKKHLDVLKITVDQEEKFEVTGTIKAMQGKQKVDGFYFSTVVPKPKDVRFYFFPVYTHQETLTPLPEALQKCLKGKSCFHFKKLDDAMIDQLDDLITRSIAIYKEEHLI